MDNATNAHYSMFLCEQEGMHSSFAGVREAGSTFVACRDKSVLEDILCEHHERVVGMDNCVRFERCILQIPADRHRAHCMKIRVKVLQTNMKAAA